MNDDDSLIRSDSEVALDELVEACASAAGVHERGHEHLGDTPLGRELHRLAQARRAATDSLIEAGLETGEVPSEPDPDKVAAEGLLQRLKNAFSTNDVAAYVQTSREAEERVEAALAEARRHEHSDRVTQELAKLDQAEAEVREHLAAAEEAAKVG